MKRQPIAAFIRQNEDNLRIAEEISAAWPDTKHSIAMDFVTRLDARLKKEAELRGWETNEFQEEDFMIGDCAHYQVGNPAWQRDSEGTFLRALRLQFYKGGKWMELGVSRNTNDKTQMPFSPKILESVKRSVGHARAKPWWEAVIRLRSPALDWSRPSALWRMRAENDEEFLEAVASQFLEFRRLAGPILDKLASGKRIE